ncbi:MAG: hypothetical protein ACOC97_01450 [Myxococcota bacterium]
MFAWVADLLWKLECRSNRRLTFRSTHPGTVVFDRRGTDPSSFAQRHGPRDARLAVVITTHARPQPCARLLEQLHASLDEAGQLDSAFVLLFEDRSPVDYGPVQQLLESFFPGRHAVYVPRTRVGKRGFWQVHHQAAKAVQALGAPHALYLQDDLELVPGFVRRALAQWSAIQDPRKAVLNLCVMPDDEPEGRWVRHRRQALSGGEIRRTQWFDLPAFLAGPRFFQVIGSEVFPTPPTRWARDASRSSGVGEQLTRRLHGRANVYQLAHTLVLHGDEESVMNPDARATRRMDNRRARSWLPSP